jgi:hypothetical protein
MSWLKYILPAVAIVGVAVAVGSRRCTVLDTPEKVNRWGNKNKNRTPDKFVIVGAWEPSWHEVFCDSPAVETVILDFKKLVGAQLDMLQDQGFSTAFPDENIVIAFRKHPSPQVYLRGGDGYDEGASVRMDVDRFLAGEINGEPVVLPGAGPEPRSAPTTIVDLFGAFRG